MNKSKNNSENLNSTKNTQKPPNRNRNLFKYMQFFQTQILTWQIIGFLWNSSELFECGEMRCVTIYLWIDEKSVLKITLFLSGFDFKFKLNYWKCLGNNFSEQKCFKLEQKLFSLPKYLSTCKARILLSRK